MMRRLAAAWLAVVLGGPRCSPGHQGGDPGEDAIVDPGDVPGDADAGEAVADAPDADDLADVAEEGIPGFSCADTGSYVNPPAGSIGHTEISRWKGGRSAALTINFDDSTPGQALIGVPAMVARGLTGTWFVNPGTDSYLDHQDVWETYAPASFQELANHSMDHAGAADYADAEYQIGEAAGIIVSAYPPTRSPLMGFNRGGGTTWNVTEDQIQSLLEEFHCIERLYSSGIYPATPADTMFTEVKEHLSSGGWYDDWGNIHFHGICNPEDTVNCVCDTPGTSSNCREYGGGVNNGAVSSAQFEAFLDALVADGYFAEDVWIAGFGSAHKYQSERNAARVVMVPDTEEPIVLCLTSTLDPVLYDEALTLTTLVADDWTLCVAEQGGASLPCGMAGGAATFDAVPDRGAVVLRPE